MGKLIKQDFIALLPFFLFFLILTLLVSGNFFFWDTVQLSSKQAHFYYTNGYKDLLLPNSIDSGHPPIMGMALAFLWKIFSKSLIVSHLFIFPFLIGIVIQMKNTVLPR